MSYNTLRRVNMEDLYDKEETTNKNKNNKYSHETSETYIEKHQQEYGQKRYIKP